MRRVLDTRRLALWGVAAILLAAAFLLASPRSGSSSSPAPIDTAASVDPSQCAPCHLDLGHVKRPGLVFSHGNHFQVSCDGCHSRMPHRNGATDTVPMETCFACHGVQHGPQGELATRECRKCHTPTFKLRPASHTKTWAGKPHAEVGKKGVNSCMMCHDAPKDCDACHQKEKLGLPPMPASYSSVVVDKPKDPSIKIYPDGPTTMSQCVYCHPDLDAITPGRLIFAHAEHLRRDYKCETCHPKFGHDPVKGPQRPDMTSCYRCHGLQHGAQGLVATEECSKCHPKGFKLEPSDHSRKFKLGEHKTRAAQDPAYCAMCHKQQFCSDCHRGKKTSEFAPGKPVVPADHRKAEWKTTHGGLYLERKGACGACHDNDSCKRCHKTVMPHPVGWIENHRPDPGVTAADCNVCHTQRATCQKCHHQTVAKGQLIAANCVKCHAEMKTPKPTKLKNKGFAEHAVHFKAKLRDRPLQCDDCHIGFSTVATSKEHAGTSNGALPNAGHDVRLCYSCHGAVDYRNQIIAPYPGAELCRRCHTDLNI